MFGKQESTEGGKTRLGFVVNSQCRTVSEKLSLHDYLRCSVMEASYSDMQMSKQSNLSISSTQLCCYPRLRQSLCQLDLSIHRVILFAVPDGNWPLMPSLMTIYERWHVAKTGYLPVQPLQRQWWPVEYVGLGPCNLPAHSSSKR